MPLAIRSKDRHEFGQLDLGLEGYDAATLLRALSGQGLRGAETRFDHRADLAVAQRVVSAVEGLSEETRRPAAT